MLLVIDLSWDLFLFVLYIYLDVGVIVHVLICYLIKF